MDLLPSVEQEEIIRVVQAFLQSELPIQSIRERRNDVTPIDANIWKKCGDLGWFGLGLDEALGGVGYGMAEEALLFRELGRNLASGPFIGSALGARVAAMAGDTTLRDAILSGVASVGIGEPHDRHEVSIGPTASGSFECIDAVGATHLLIYSDDSVALIDTTLLPHQELLDCIDPGIRLSRVTLANVPTVATLSVGGAAVRLRGTTLVSAMLSGIAEATRDLSSEYAKVREQFGKPIGVNQAIKHACADMATRAEAATSQLFFAASSIDEDRGDVAFQVASARIVSANAAIENAEHTIQVHGGMGYTFEHDANLFLKRAQVLERLLGDSSEQLRILITLPAAQ
jgi:alkylation response protein AidB-like acyl-CoA dehydrogenase